jgi:multiple sugar transport system permease protein
MAVFTRSRRRVDDSNERTLVSPLTLKRPTARAIYWTVFALLLVFTLITFGPLYWMFSSALKSSIEIFQTPPTIWPLHPAWINYASAWNVLQYPLYFGNTVILAAGAVVLQLLVSPRLHLRFQSYGRPAEASSSLFSSLL